MKKTIHFNFLTNDLIEEILIRVPAKTLYRSKSVCKFWKSLISSPSFINHITAGSNSLPPLITGVFGTDIVYTDEGSTKVYFYSFGNQMSIDSQFDTSLSFLQRPIVAVASHNGILLCAENTLQSRRYSYTGSMQYLLCNPFTKKWVSLPKSNFDHDINNVSLLSYEVDQHIEFAVFSFLESVSLVDKYCSKTGGWNVSSISGLRAGFCISSMRCHVLFDGFIYFCDDSRHLCVYNVKEKRACFVELPIAQYTISQCLGVSSGSLYYAESDDISLSVWELVDGVEWALTHSIEYESLINEFPEIPDYLYPFSLLSFYPSDGNILLAESDSGWQQVLYHISKRQTEVIDVINIKPYFPVIPYSLPVWPPCIKDT